MNFKTKFKKNKGITLIALVVTIIVLLILAGISITMLTGQNGILNRASDAKIAQGISQVEEIGKLRLQAAYAENLSVIDDATAKTAVLAELQEKGYEVENFNTSDQTVKGLIVRDSSGQNKEEITLKQGNSVTINITLDTEGDITSKSYVKIEGSYYELTITGLDVTVSREAYKKPAEQGSGYKIKLTPPTSGIEMIIEGKTLSGESPIVAGADITVKAGNSTGTFAFTAKEEKSNITKSVNVNVVTNEQYATGLNIKVKDNGSTTVAPGATVNMVAEITPSTATDTVKWTIDSGSATIDETTGVITIGESATNGSTVVVGATLVRGDGTDSTVGKQTLTLTVKASNGENAGQILSKTDDEIKEYFGGVVENYQTDNNIDDGDAKWEVYYIGADPATGENNIYLILNDYMHVINAPDPDTGTAKSTNSVISKFATIKNIIKDTANNIKISKAPGLPSGDADKKLPEDKRQTTSFEQVYNNKRYTSNGLSFILPSSQAKGWFSLKVSATERQDNMGSTAYMLDTEIWTNVYKDSDYTKYVIGGPTLELLCASWNKKYPNNKLYYSTDEAEYYYIGTTSQEKKHHIEIPSVGIKDTLYVGPDKDNVGQYWIASPVNYKYFNENYNVGDDFIGIGDFITDISQIGLRPVVCLKSNVKLTKTENGTYTLE